MSIPTLNTERLILRPWREGDRAPFAALNSDTHVMEFLGSPLSREQSDAMVDRIVAKWDSDGTGLWAVEVRGGAEFIGFIGLALQTFPSHFTPCIEVGWRLGRDWWGQGFAPEGALEALRYGFEVRHLDEIVSMTTVGNTKSRRVMEKIGLHCDERDDFEHPNVAAGDPLRQHVLYRRSRSDWFASASRPVI